MKLERGVGVDPQQRGRDEERKEPIKNEQVHGAARFGAVIRDGSLGENELKNVLNIGWLPPDGFAESPDSIAAKELPSRIQAACNDEDVEHGLVP